MMQTKRSSMKATAVANKERSIYVNLAEPVNVNDKGGPLMVTALRARGLPFMKAPKSYYVELREKLKTTDAKFKKDIDEIEKLQLLVDFDSEGYLIQTFTKMMQDRPTLVIEIIQRHNKTGFGEGNYKALYEASEAELADRGN